MSEHNAEKGSPLTLAEASELVGDDIEFWLNNPFMPPDLIGEKVRWWITKAAAASVTPPAEGLL